MKQLKSKLAKPLAVLLAALVGSLMAFAVAQGGAKTTIILSDGTVIESEKKVYISDSVLYELTEVEPLESEESEESEECEQVLTFGGLSDC